nr:peroxisomal multifunctional enzyme type 2-like [Lytechinus pictus]
MGEDLRFDGRVALVTGAGGGLGKEYALLLAARGASVVVNDLGGDRAGQGKSAMAADQVVNEIRSKGGKAVPNYDSVEDGDKLVQTALDNYGRIDIVINNAGILRDRSFARISDVDWDLIQRVHLRGSFLVTRAAWPHMKKQKYGRIIMTSSASGLYGNFGQANYSAAKLGLVGLSNTLSREGAKYNIFCNTIAPVAASRLTQDIMPPDIFEKLKPDYVAPMVAYLGHEDCKSTGGIYECGAGWAAKLRWQRTAGANCLKPNQPYTVEQVRDNWEEICNFDGKVTYPSSSQDSMMLMLESFNAGSSDEESPASSSSDTGGDGDDDGGFNPSKAIGFEMQSLDFEYTSRDVILYALGVGVSTTQPDYLKFLFELNEDFCVLPTFGVIPAFAGLSNLTSVPGLQTIDVTRILHGEQYLELKKPLSASMKLTNKPMVVDIVDKKSGALIITNVNSYDENGELIVVNQNVVFLVGAGGFGGKRSSPHLKETVKAPSREPDASMKEKTSVDQAALYRLSGDYNPLHIDPSFAAMGGFKQPILHGLCSFGFACRHVLKQYANNDVTKFKSIKVRFSKPVLPGQTIQTDMWQEGSRIHFQSKVAETGAVCISGAYVDLHGGAELANAAGNQPPSPGLKSEMVLSAANEIVSSSPDLVKKVNGVIQFNITSNGKVAAVWTFDLKGTGAVYQGEPKSGKANATVTVSDDDFVALASGALQPQTAFLSGKIKIKGQIMLLQKLLPLFQSFVKGKL